MIKIGCNQDQIATKAIIEMAAVFKEVATDRV
jgi:hypothetical protein